MVAHGNRTKIRFATEGKPAYETALEPWTLDFTLKLTARSHYNSKIVRNVTEYYENTGTESAIVTFNKPEDAEIWRWSHILHVGNLSKDVTAKKLYDHFINNCNPKKTPFIARVLLYQTNRDTNYAHVFFYDRRSSIGAINTLNYLPIPSDDTSGAPLHIARYEPTIVMTQPTLKRCTIKLRNDLIITEGLRGLYDKFKEYGNIRYCKKSGENGGFDIVQFEHLEATQAAIDDIIATQDCIDCKTTDCLTTDRDWCTVNVRNLPSDLTEPLKSKLNQVLQKTLSQYGDIIEYSGITQRTDRDSVQSCF